MIERFRGDSAPWTSADIAEHREAAKRAEEERALARERELESQSSPVAEPRERIRIWERLHALSLPESTAHPLVNVIAAQTQLARDDVMAEQQRRRSLNQPPT